MGRKVKHSPFVDCLLTSLIKQNLVRTDELLLYTICFASL